MKALQTRLTAVLIVTLCLVGMEALGASLTWDALPGDAIDDGSGTWLTPGQWNDGSPSASWVNDGSASAVIGSGGAGGTITLGNIIAGSVTFTNFTSTYTLSEGSLTNSGGITVAADAGNITITSLIGGDAGLVMAGSGRLKLKNKNNSYTGNTVITKGILRLGDTHTDANSIPGGIGNATSGSNLELNGGTVTVCYYLKRTLGSGAGQLQLTGGNSGFSHRQSDTYGRVDINNSTSYEIVWGTAYWKPDALVLNDANAEPTQVVNIRNKIDLNGTNRTVACNSTTAIGPARVDDANGNINTAGGRLTGVIRNSGGTPAGIIKTGPGYLQLTAANTYDGDTTVNEGTLELQTINANNDASTVRIASNATMKLSYAGSDTVNRLFIDGTQTVAGVYGNTDSGADNGGAGLGAFDTFFDAGAGTLTTTDDISPPQLPGTNIVDNKFGGPIVMGTLVTYTVDFGEDMDATTVTTADFSNGGSATSTVDSVAETTTTSGVFTVQVTPTSTGTLQLQVNDGAVLLDTSSNALDTASVIADDTVITVTATDSTPPTLAGDEMTEDVNGGPITVGTTVGYTVTFSEDMDETTVTTVDFGNAGDAPFTVDAVTETAPNSGVFTVSVTPTGAGTLQLQINASAVLHDMAGNPLDTASAILDDVTITVDGTLPTLAGGNIVDDRGGAGMTVGSIVTYTVTFSEDIDASTVTTTDFGNNGSGALTVDSVTETTATSGVFTVVITATGSGTIQLRVNAGADLRDVAGNALNTTAAIADDTVMTATLPSLSWDANGTTAGQTDGDGTWLDANQWWTGSANQNWAPTAPATIGNGGSGGEITLGSIVADSVTFADFSGIYTLTGGSLTNSSGITVATNTGDVTIHSLIGGTGGITKHGSGLLLLKSHNNYYTGPTIINSGVLSAGEVHTEKNSIPGGGGGSANGSHLQINGGSFTFCYGFSRTLGPAPENFQITGGTSGFNTRQADNYGNLIISNSTSYEVVWGSTYFKPDVLVMNAADGNATQSINFKNKLDLNGATRSVNCGSPDPRSSYVNANNGWLYSAGGRFSGVVRNSSGSPAGLIKLGAGVLQLEADNTFDGGLDIREGTLSFTKNANVGSANPLGQSSAAASNLLIASGATLQYNGGYGNDATCDRDFTFNITNNASTVTLKATGSGAITYTSTTSPEYTTPGVSCTVVLEASGTGTNTLMAGIANNGSGEVSLHKDGAGTWALTGRNTYKGNTVVTNGILRLRQERALPSPTCLYLYSGGTIDLDFTGSQQLSGLYIDGEEQPSGIYSANGSTISGTGALQVGGFGLRIIVM